MSFVKVLLIDDAPDFLELLQKEIRERVSEKIEFYFADNSYAAKKVLAEETIHIIVTDLYMPDGQGVDLVMDLYQQDDRPKYVFIISGFIPKDKEKLTEQFYFYSKPLEDTFYSKLKSCFTEVLK